MAAARGRPPASVVDRLYREPAGFDFFQAVRLLEAAARHRAAGRDVAGAGRVGEDGDPAHDVVRFRAAARLSFPTTAIEALAAPTPGSPPEMTVSFLGLTGPSGVLPQHYTETLIRAQRSKSGSLRQFFDLFHHRTVSLFYRAWRKYRLPVAYEAGGPAGDPISHVVESLVGLATGRLRARLAVDDRVLFYYAGHFAGLRRSAVGLQHLLSEHFGRPVTVRQFRPRQLAIPAEAQSRLAGPGLPDGAFCRLGVDAVVGARAVDVTSSVTLELGPLSREQFRRFLPGGADFDRLVALTRLYVGADLGFAVALSIDGAEVPDCRLPGPAPAADAPQLGHNMWVGRRPLRGLKTDAVFEAPADG